jgi:hypothetical protein
MYLEGLRNTTNNAVRTGGVADLTHSGYLPSADLESSCCACVLVVSYLLKDIKYISPVTSSAVDPDIFLGTLFTITLYLCSTLIPNVQMLRDCTIWLHNITE